MATSDSTLPPIDAGTALFLDFDGTLADLAHRPDAVATAPGLVDTLIELSARLDGALAIVSGRPASELGTFLAPFAPALAAEHGAMLRHADASEFRSPPPDLDEVRRAARALAQVHSELLVEEKPAALALHYRAAPILGALCLDTLSEVVDRDPRLSLLHGKFVVEVKAVHVDKGRAIETLMAREPFAGRRPVFVGDDVTDEAGFRYVQSVGGEAVKVGEGDTVAAYRCNSPASVRAWLERAASRFAGTSPAVDPDSR